MHTTKTLTTMHHTVSDIKRWGGDVLLVDGDATGYTVSFADADRALAQLVKVKDASWQAYLRAGGNPMNRRAHGSQFAQVRRAILAAG